MMPTAKMPTAKVSLLLWASTCLVVVVLAAGVASASGLKNEFEPEELMAAQQPQPKAQNLPALRGLSSSSSNCSEKNPCKFKMVADLGERESHKSEAKEGKLYQDSKGNYKVKTEGSDSMDTKLNYAGKALGLSELVIFQKMWLALDDKSGIGFDISEEEPWPREVFAAENGDNEKGMNIQWATWKDDDLYVGSYGDSSSTQWVVKMSEHGKKSYINWSKVYGKVEDALDADSCKHEAVLWSEKQKKWIFVPREFKGKDDDHHKMVLCDESCSKADVKDLGSRKSKTGLSSMRFVPGTDEKVILAINAYDSGNSQKSYMTVFTTDGQVLMEDEEVSKDKKYGGFAFED